jgi:hypothetical protein
MPAVANIDINAPLDEIIDVKISHLNEVIASSMEQVDALKKMKHMYLNSVLNGKTTNENEENTEQKTVLEKVSQKNVRPYVESFLKKNGGQFTSVEVYEELRKEMPEIDSRRNEWVAAISGTLNTLATYGKADSYPTGVGRIKRYEWKKEASVDFANQFRENDLEDDLPF